MNTSFSGRRIFNYAQDNQRATVVRLRLREELAERDPDHAAFVRRGPPGRRGGQNNQGGDQRSNETAKYFARKPADAHLISLLSCSDRLYLKSSAPGNLVRN